MKNSRYKTVKIIIILLVVLATLGYWGEKISEASDEMDEYMKQHLPSRHTISSLESALIAEKYRNRLAVNRVYLNKVINPVALLVFDKTYNLIEYKIDLKTDTSLKHILHTEMTSVEPTLGVTYTILYRSYEELRLR